MFTFMCVCVYVSRMDFSVSYLGQMTTAQMNKITITINNYVYTNIRMLYLLVHKVNAPHFGDVDVTARTKQVVLVTHTAFNKCAAVLDPIVTQFSVGKKKLSIFEQNYIIFLFLYV